MRAIFHAELENGAVIEDPFYFRQGVGKGVLKDVFNNWKDLISQCYGTKIKTATYEFKM
jgi:hypothetical protein